jgi:hypothetical protein
MEHPLVDICPSLCVGKNDKKEIKPSGPLWGPLTKVSNTQVFRPFHPVLPFVSLGMEEKEH